MSSGQNRRLWYAVRLLFTVGLGFLTCMALTGLAVNLKPRLLVVALNLEHVGPLEGALAPHSEPLVLDGEAQDRVAVTLPPRVVAPLTLTPAQLGGPVIGDASSPGTTIYLLTVAEDALNQLLRRQGLSDRAETGRYRDLEIDLQPGGLVLYGDVHLGLRRQRMGLLLLHHDGHATLSPGGVVLDQELYALPESGALARVLLPAGREVQRSLRALTVVGPLAGEAHVEAVRFHSDRLEILARATYPAPPLPDTGWQSVEPGVELREIDVAPDPQRPPERLRIVRLDPGQVRFRIRYDPADPKPVSGWSAEAEPLLVVNGGYFAPRDEGGETIGLLVSDGARWGAPLGGYAGMFAVTAADAASVRWMESAPFDPAEPLAQAVQSFPVLVRPGGVMGFPLRSDGGEMARRTVVAQDTGGNILFIVAPRGHLSLHDTAAFLAASDLMIDVALNLDGGGSTGMWMVAGDVRVEIDSFTLVPSVITVHRR